MSPQEMAVKASGEHLADQMDSFLTRVLTLHDIGKALPHPYDAIGEYATSVAHDFTNMAYGFRKYIESTKPVAEAAP